MTDFLKAMAMVVAVQQPSAECTSILNQILCLTPPTSLYSAVQYSALLGEIPLQGLTTLTFYSSYHSVQFCDIG